MATRVRTFKTKLDNLGRPQILWDEEMTDTETYTTGGSSLHSGNRIELSLNEDQYNSLCIKRFSFAQPFRIRKYPRYECRLISSDLDNSHPYIVAIRKTKAKAEQLFLYNKEGFPSSVSKEMALENFEEF